MLPLRNGTQVLSRFGRSPGCRAVLSTEQLSPCHCVLTRGSDYGVDFVKRRGRTFLKIL